MGESQVAQLHLAQKGARLLLGTAALLVVAQTFVPGLKVHGQQGPGDKAGQRDHAPSGWTGAAADPGDLETPQRQVPDPGVIPTNQRITPAGVQSVFESRVFGIAFGASSSEVYVATDLRGGALVYRLDWQSNRVLDKLVDGGSEAGMQGVTFDPATRSLLMTTVGQRGARVVMKGIDCPDHELPALGTNEIASVAVSPAHAPGTHYGVAALTWDDEAAILDLGKGEVLARVRTGVAPFGTIIDATNTTAYVSNWGGRSPQAGDRTLAGRRGSPGKMVVDERGVAASGTVSRIDLRTGTVTASIEVGLHPTSLALDNARSLLYVANANSDTLSVIDTRQNRVTGTIPLQPFSRPVVGIVPESLVLSADGRHLYVACAGINAVMVLDLGEDSRFAISGLIPTAYYPDSIALSPDGRYLGVATMLGVGSGWKRAPRRFRYRTWDPPRCSTETTPVCRFVHSYRGTIHVIPVPDRSALDRYSIAVAANTHQTLPGSAAPSETARAAAPAAPMPVPMRAGDPSPIKHILYVIKENRTYDQFFGSLGRGNGDPQLNLYGEDVVPNHRALARQFVVLDNFYATGGNSAEGHQWVTEADETDYGYLLEGRNDPDGGQRPMTAARSGYLWNAAERARVSFADFGEFAQATGRDIEGLAANPGRTRRELLEEFNRGASFANRFSAGSGVETLDRYIVHDYPGWTLSVPDVVRARIFEQHLREWEAAGSMPSLVMLLLPADHTAGQSPGFSDPQACTADNDYALGLIVDAVTHSRFWASTLIFVVEDDAQDGIDHVDGHRTVALAISPYIRHGAVDSTFYSQPSMLKTMELILGIGHMTLFDEIANDMRNSFQATPDLTPYTAARPEYPLLSVVPPLQSLRGQSRSDAEASLRMNFSIPDAAPAEELNRIIWRSIRGSSLPYPAIRTALFTPSAAQAGKSEERER